VRDRKNFAPTIAKLLNAEAENQTSKRDLSLRFQENVTKTSLYYFHSAIKAGDNLASFEEQIYLKRWKTPFVYPGDNPNPGI